MPHKVGDGAPDLTEPCIPSVQRQFGSEFWSAPGQYDHSEIFVEWPPNQLFVHLDVEFQQKWDGLKLPHPIYASGGYDCLEKRPLGLGVDGFKFPHDVSQS